MPFKLSMRATLLALVALLSILGSPAFAQLNLRAFVSGHGADSGNCPVTAPCRSFAYAISQTAPSGEIAVLDTAGYGPLTITKAISIVNSSGVEAGITVQPGGSAITINAGSTDVVALRGLTLEGNGDGQFGITFNTGGRLEVTDCVIRDFTNSGIFATITSSGGIVTPGSNDNTTILVASTRVLNNLNAGIYLTPSAGYVNFSFDQVTVDDNNYGIYIDSSHGNSDPEGSITNSSVNNNNTAGVTAAGQFGAVNIKDTSIHLTTTGVVVSGSFQSAYLSRTNIFNAGTAISIANGAHVYSAGNNDFSLTGTPVSGGTLSSSPEQ